MDIYGKMKELGLALPQAPARGGMYASCKAFGKGLYYVSGCGPVIGEPIEGRLGREFGIGEGKQYAQKRIPPAAAFLTMGSLLRQPPP